MRRRTVTLSEEQEQELRHCRDHHRLPYMRLDQSLVARIAAGDHFLVGRYPTVARCYSSTGFPGMQAHQYPF